MVFRLIPARTFKCFAVNRNPLILLAIPPSRGSHCVRLCVSFGQAVGVVDAYCWPKDCATVHGEPTRKTVRRGVALPNGESSPPRSPPRVPSSAAGVAEFLNPRSLVADAARGPTFARHRVPRAAEGRTGCGWRGGMRPHYTPCVAADLCTAAAAVRITSSTCLGWESIGTWLLFISTVVAPMRFAANFITRPHFGSGEKCALTIFQSRPRLA